MIRRLALVLLCCCAPINALAQTLDLERDRHMTILNLIKKDVEKHYFDPKFKGVDLEAKFSEAQANIKAATSVGHLSSAVAQFLAEFDDSHLFYVPPSRTNVAEYGFEYRMFGDKCLVHYVSKDSDAAKKGLRIGDQLRAISSFGPTRESLWKIRYFFSVLFQQPSLNLSVVKPDGTTAEYNALAKIRKGSQITELDPNYILRESEKAYKRETRQYYYDKFEQAFIWRMPGFSLDPAKTDEVIGRARKHPAIIFDLRGNGGGRVDMLQRLIGSLFRDDVKVGDEVRRKSKKELIAKGRGDEAYIGKVIVLVDSASGSASEVFARVLQLEKRGTVWGDRSAGAVMESQLYPHDLGHDIVIAFGASITIADLLMKDGKSLEKIGVNPDNILIPTASDVAEKKDVVLAAVLRELGIEITPEAAGRLLPEDADYKG